MLYRPPSSRLEILYEPEKSMSLLSSHGKHISNNVLTGDFNLPNLHWSEKEYLVELETQIKHPTGKGLTAEERSKQEN